MNLPVIDLMRLDTKSLNEFIQWANEKVSIAQTLLTTRKKTPSKKTSNDYRREKENRIFSVMKTILKEGDYVQVIGSTQKTPAKVISIGTDFFRLDRGGLMAPTYHSFGKVRAHGKTPFDMQAVQ